MCTLYITSFTVYCNFICVLSDAIIKRMMMMMMMMGCRCWRWVRGLDASWRTRPSTVWVTSAVAGIRLHRVQRVRRLAPSARSSSPSTTAGAISWSRGTGSRCTASCAIPPRRGVRCCRESTGTCRSCRSYERLSGPCLYSLSSFLAVSLPLHHRPVAWCRPSSLAVALWWTRYLCQGSFLFVSVCSVVY